MRVETSERPDPSRPALEVTYGFSPRKVWPLEGDLVFVGKGRACDLGLLSPEVAELHCVLVRTGGGWRLRDCGSRLGTRVNGRAVAETALCDGDVIQVGNFNFRAHLPPVAPRPEAAAANPGDVDRTMAVLRERLRECEQKQEELRQEERELARDRAALDADYAAFQARVDRAEQALARQQSEVEARCRALEKRLAASAADADEARRLDQRRRELDQYAAHLRRLAQRLAAAPGAAAVEVAQLRAQLAAARRANEEKEQQIQRLLAQRPAADPSPAGMDLESYEAELAEFRRQLQEDRRGLNDEIRELRSRTLALEDAARAREEQLALEQAKMAEERAELDRLRQEVRADAGAPAAPGRLTGTHRLKGTMARMIGPLPTGGPTAHRDKPASNSCIPRVRLPRRGDA